MGDLGISRRRTQTHTDILAERLARIKRVIASRKKAKRERKAEVGESESRRVGESESQDTRLMTLDSILDTDFTD